MARDYSKFPPQLSVTPWFKKLSDRGKLLYYTYFHSPHQNACGCARFANAYLADDLHWTPSEYHAVREELRNVGLIAVDQISEEVFVRGWFRWNPPMNKSHHQYILKNIARIASAELGQLVAEELNDTKWADPADAKVLDRYKTDHMKKVHR